MGDRSMQNEVGFTKMGKMDGKIIENFGVDLTESSKARLKKAERLIEDIGNKLHISKDVIDQAKIKYWYAKLDLKSNFVQGWETKIVAAVVLYLCCRL